MAVFRDNYTNDLGNSMPSKRPAYGVPDFLVFGRILALAFVLAETCRLAFILGSRAVPSLEAVCDGWKYAGLLLSVAIVVAYIAQRSAHRSAEQFLKSRRLDLLLTGLLGIWLNQELTPFLKDVHALIGKAESDWPLMTLAVMLMLLASPVIRHVWSLRKKDKLQLYFLGDQEITEENDDLLDIKRSAKSFATTVLESGANSSLVFGIDGPWGTGKTSFVNMAARHWLEKGSERVIVFRFEPLRYASEPDLPAKFIRDLSAAMRGAIYAPEFPNAASRYSRMLSGKADISFLGFKISLEPSSETIDEVLTNIDDVLKRIRRRLIVVVDDLDRLDAKTVNNVLFAVRRTYNLSQATYVLCYDTEVLAGASEDSQRTRQFLEKFITVKLSLFVDTKSLSDFLRKDWKADPSKFPTIPPATMLSLSALCSALVEILDGPHAASYLPVVGNLRKVKRFVNAALLMRMEHLDVERTDFYPSDLVHLILLHLHYPGVFRDIYATEAEGRTGRYSIQSQGKSGNRSWQNSVEFKSALAACPDEPSRFLVRQLFDADVIGLNNQWSFQAERFLRGRACFNTGSYRNLETYLGQIVRFSTPEPRKTFRLFQSAVDEVIGGASISVVLARDDFSLSENDLAHQQFWRILISQAHTMKQAEANQCIDGLIEILPKYSALSLDGMSARQRAIYLLAQLIDSAGWGRSLKRPANTPENLSEIADRIFGLKRYSRAGVIERLASDRRGALGWFDLMVFRMTCSADRGGQLYNVSTALVKHQDPNGKTEGLVSDIARLEMRALSQAVFGRFHARYISTSLNFFDEVDQVSDDAFLGDTRGDETRDRALAAGRQQLKSYVIYQLANSQDANGAGIGCGYYDEAGGADQGGIGKAMNRYLFDVCFNVEVNPKNAFHFADYCLRNFQNAFFLGGDEEGYVATETGLTGGLDKQALVEFWSRLGSRIKSLHLTEMDIELITSSYSATYKEDLPKAFEVLDRLGVAKGVSVSAFDDAEAIPLQS